MGGRGASSNKELKEYKDLSKFGRKIQKIVKSNKKQRYDYISYNDLHPTRYRIRD